MRKYIDLSNAVLIGTGDHKKVFIDPADTHKCIKVLFRTPDEDLERELAYRKIREKRGLKSKLLTTYFGMVETNFGTGYVFEHVIDFDGSTSRTLAQLLKNAVADTRLVPVVTKVMCNFKAMWFEELISVSNVEPGNFMVQRYSWAALAFYGKTLLGEIPRTVAIDVARVMAARVDERPQHF